MTSAPISTALSAAVVSVVKKRKAGSGGENDNTVLFQMADGAAPDVGLRHFLHVYGGQNPCGTPSCSNACCNAREFMTVASMPM